MMPNFLDRLRNADRLQRQRQMTHTDSYNQNQSIEDMQANALANLRNAPGRMAQGITAGIVGAPVDIANMMLKPIGLGSENPVGGSNYLARLMNADTSSVPYQVGTMLPISPEMAVGAAKGLPLAMAGIFAGRGAKTADLIALDKAQEMAKSGIPDSQIWKETGWTLDTPDKIPRFEIPDDAAYISHPYPEAVRLHDTSINAKSMAEAKTAGEQYNEVMDMVRRSPALHSMSVTASDDIGGLVHPELMAGYNKLPRMWYENIGQARGGEYLPDENRIRLGLGTYAIPKEAQSTALHELQHAIQQREGFARGGSPDTSFGAGMTQDNTMEMARQAYERSHQSSGDPLLAELFADGVKPWDSLTQREKLGWIDQARKDSYQRLAGEAEARLTQARMYMTPEQRAAQYPYDPAYFEQATGVPLNSLIVRRDGWN